MPDPSVPDASTSDGSMATPSAIPPVGATRPDAAGAPATGRRVEADDPPAEATPDEPSLALPRPPFREIVVHPLPAPPRDA